jgi:hypothetical protein
MRRRGWAVLAAALLAVAAIAVAVILATESGGPAKIARSPACLPSAIDPSARLPGTSVDVSPAPGTGMANPHTQVSFRGAPASRLAGVAVVGSRSGRHTGAMRPYSQGDGASFLPTRAFASGETVSVRATIRGRGVEFSFRVDTPYSTARFGGFPAPPAPPSDYQSFATVPGMQAPVLTPTMTDRDPAAGDIFTTNGPGPGQYGALIYTPQGRLVWFHRLTGGVTAENLQVQDFEGRPALTFWQGKVLELGFGQGEGVIMDSAYRVLARVRGGNGLQPDLHDFQLARNGVAYVTAFNAVHCDLSKAEGRADGSILDNAVQEVDIATGLVRSEWHSIDHIGVDESQVATPEDRKPWDWFHVNSIDLQPGGEILLSARSTWASYQLDGRSVQVKWRLGGTNSSFQMGPGTTVAWQHDARRLANGDVTIFDDGSNPPLHNQSRGIRIALDFKRHRARLVSNFKHNPPLLSASQGNMQPLPGGGAVIGYGAVPQISEFGADGKLRYDAHMPLDLSFYRAFRFPWRATPATPPAVLAFFNNTEEETIVKASWNGATDVASWRVLAGARPDALAPLATVPLSGFESSAILTKKYPYAAVQALDVSGRVLGVSRPVKTIGFYAAETAR